MNKYKSAKVGFQQSDVLYPNQAMSKMSGFRTFCGTKLIEEEADRLIGLAD